MVLIVPAESRAEHPASCVMQVDVDSMQAPYYL
jgi:hypothetical protein